MTQLLPFDRAPEVGAACLCLYVQRAARALARHFDEVFLPLDLTNGQFSLLMSLNRKHPPIMGEIAAALAMDRTTLTAALKPLVRRELVAVTPDAKDRRSRRLVITRAGRALLARAYPLWKTAHEALEERLAPADPDGLREALARLTSETGRG